MTDPDDRTPEEKLGEIDAMIAAQDRKEKENEQRQQERLKDPAVQRGMAIRLADNIDAYLAPAADAITAQITALVDRLLAIGLIEEGAFVRDYAADLGTGEVIPVVHGPDMTWGELGSDLVELREAHGHVEYRRLDDEGEAREPWQDSPPPPSRSKLN